MLALGCDHGGYELKLEIKKYLDEKGIEYKDFGCDSTGICRLSGLCKESCACHCER